MRRAAPVKCLENHIQPSTPFANINPGIDDASPYASPLFYSDSFRVNLRAQRGLGAMILSDSEQGHRCQLSGRAKGIDCAECHLDKRNNQSLDLHRYTDVLDGKSTD